MKLRLSPFLKTNDPREYKEWLYDEWAFGGKVEFNTHKKTEAEIRLNDLRRNKSKVACFCSNIDFNHLYYFKKKIINHYGYEKSRMWSQYGEDHSGICLVLSKEKIENKVNSISNQDIQCFKKIIEYKKMRRLDFPNLQTNKLSRMNIEEFCKFVIQSQQKNIYFIKDIDYIDESEYRIVILSEEEDYFHLDITMCLEGIIAGDNFPDKDKSLLYNIKKQYSIRKIKYDRGNYNIVEI